jgi:hypothetical protein
MFGLHKILLNFQVFYVAHILDTRLVDKQRLGMREQLLMLEIGYDSMDSASSFVDYVSEEYGFSKSSVWYNLKRLKDFGLVEFANREEIGKPLSLTKVGLGQLDGFEKSRRELVEHFNRALVQRVGPIGGIGTSYAERF